MEKKYKTITDEQYYREKALEKEGFWTGVKITLMVELVVWATWQFFP